MKRNISLTSIVTETPLHAGACMVLQIL